MKAKSISIVDQGPFHCVVNKKAGQLVVPARGDTEPTVLDDLRQKLGKNIMAVHRLDRATSGCLAFAKGKFAEQALSQAFKKRLVDKRYVAIVQGDPPFTKKTIEESLRRVDSNRKKGPAAWQEVDPAGKNACTHLRVLHRAGDWSLVEARPLTGRMHQIRVHLSFLGHPIAGDTLYGAAMTFMPDQQLGLHALLLSLPLPKGGRCFVHSPIPEPWSEWLGPHRTQVEQAIEDRARQFCAKKKHKPETSKEASSKPRSTPGPSRGRPQKKSTPRRNRRR
jgi:RluA family pseudouridine synthase